eukprot:Hpha_TRINITY_DN14917_c0_g2::TRINITY_DN14917_c0_g2_i1::g.144702::m.144702
MEQHSTQIVVGCQRKLSVVDVGGADVLVEPGGPLVALYSGRVALNFDGHLALPSTLQEAQSQQREVVGYGGPDEESRRGLDLLLGVVVLPREPHRHHARIVVRPPHEPKVVDVTLLLLHPELRPAVQPGEHTLPRPVLLLLPHKHVLEPARRRGAPPPVHAVRREPELVELGLEVPQTALYQTPLLQRLKHQPHVRRPHKHTEKALQLALLLHGLYLLDRVVALVVVKESHEGTGAWVLLEAVLVDMLEEGISATVSETTHTTTRVEPVVRARIQAIRRVHFPQRLDDGFDIVTAVIGILVVRLGLLRSVDVVLKFKQRRAELLNVSLTTDTPRLHHDLPHRLPVLRLRTAATELLDRRHHRREDLLVEHLLRRDLALRL